LRYDNPNAAYAPTGTPAATPQYNGNISQAIWQVRGREKQVYTFQYDFLNRMTEANYAEINTAGARTNDQNKYMEKLTYDLRGNIKTLQRKGLNTTSCAVGLIDDLTYYYADDTNISYSPGNRLKKVFDTSDKARGFKTPSSNTSLTNAAFLYTYDVNGNLKTDPNKGIIGITYNHLNLPTLITFTGNRTIAFLYDGGGTKLKKTVVNNGVTDLVQDYVGGIEYRTTPSVPITLEAIYHSEGRITNITGSLKYEYALRDHLGNTRLMFCDKSGDGVITQSLTQEIITSEVTQENSYYPFGLAMEGVWANTPSVVDNKYTYNGKEINSDFGLELMDYGARFYDAALGRWHSVDPMAEAAPHLTPYRYSFNNPFNFIDPDGMFEGTVSGDKYRDKNENYDGVRATANAASDREQNKKAMDDLVAKAEENGGIWSRDVKITVTNEIVKDNNGNDKWAIVYGYPRVKGSEEFYQVPVYNAIIEGTNEEGGAMQETFEVVRFGVEIAGKNRRVVDFINHANIGKVGNEYPLTYDPMSTMPGLHFRVKGGYFFHDFPDNYTKVANGLKGCTGVPDWGGFLEKVRRFSGIKTFQENMEYKNIKAVYQEADTPPLLRRVTKKQ
jgi:RHS repeat-associated protein